MCNGGVKMKKKIGIGIGVVIILFFVGFAGFKSFNQTKEFATPVDVTSVKVKDLESKIFTRGILKIR